MDRARPIVVVGSHVAGLVLEVDAVPREGESVLGRGFSEPEDGGKATNQAVAAAKLGAPVRLVTLLGDDERGDRWRALLEGYGMDTTYVMQQPGATDVGFVLLPPSRIPAIASSIELSVALEFALIERAGSALEDASLVLCQLEAPQGCALASFRLARAAGARTVLNPAPAQQLTAELLALTDILVPNEHEAAVLAGRNGTPSQLADRLCRQRGGEAVIVTAGDDGCYVATGGPPEHLAPPDVVAVDTTGAGDAFIGALAVGLREGDSLREAAAFAVRAAALSVTRPGTMPAYATVSELVR
ncbi:MAG TPA: ribokinase [Gaiellales bacterium]|jgi:ribokinase|nr:ribokinase [Gaiellales bacterium]